MKESVYGNPDFELFLDMHEKNWKYNTNYNDFFEK